MHGNRRREPRHRVRQQVSLLWRRRELVVESEDVSFRGLMVRTDEELPERQLLKLRVRLPDGVELALTGMVVRRISPWAGGPGVAIQLYGLGPEDRARWERFVRGVGGAAREELPRRLAATA